MTFSRAPGLASVLLRIFRSRDARAATVEAAALRLTCASGPGRIPLGDIDSAELKAGWRWGRVKVRHASGTAAVSGLTRSDAEALAEALEAARAGWWRRELAARSEALRSVRERLAQFDDPPGYVGRSLCRDLERAAREVAGHFPGRWPDTLSDAPEAGMLAAVREFLDSPDALRARANETYVARELERCRAFFDRVEARPLTDEQRRAVVVDEDRNLVVAAAGSGKTSVIVAKAGWLVLRGFRRPSELLLLAFARDARDELDERIRGRLGDEAAGGATVRTFHSLGMSIIGRAEGRRPSLARAAQDDRALIDLLKEILAGLLAARKVSDAVLRWFMGQFAPCCSHQEFSNWGEYWEYLRRFDIRSLKGERVRSMEECEIANFLYLNSVPYEYEAPYEHDTATPEKVQYRPDFHLPEAGIYIEHFGVDAEGRTAPFVDEKKYRQEMEWKRRLHEEKGTVLIETFSRERAAGALIARLREKLAAHGVALSPLPPAEVFAVLQRQGRIDPFLRLLATFLHHFKGAQLSLEELSRRAAGAGDPLRAEAFLAVFRPVFERYQETLSGLGEIDFHDMIDKATEHVEAGRYRSPFGYILVDEFQDISPARARLLKALLDQSPTSRLFAVGDDWQSIFRFAGSDTAVMRDFGKHFGASERIDLETTFRCPETIAEAATRFVLANPSQIRKEVRSTRQVDGPCVHVGLAGEKGLSLLSEALDRIAADAEARQEVSSVLLLGRYRHLQPPDLPSLARQYPRLRLSFMTVHGSKGLEADYAVVLGLCSGRHGFPSEIADDPLLDLVLSAPDEHPNAEERRLLYVAMTRARRQVYLLADGGPPSPFVQELIEGGGVAVFGRSPEEEAPCPRCVEGRLVHRERARDRSVFHGCSNWPYCRHRQPACPACGQGLPVAANGGFRCRDCRQRIEACPACGGWLQTRMGRHGRFLGCSNWPECGYTRDSPGHRD